MAAAVKREQARTEGEDWESLRRSSVHNQAFGHSAGQVVWEVF